MVGVAEDELLHTSLSFPDLLYCRCPPTYLRNVVSPWSISRDRVRSTGDGLKQLSNEHSQQLGKLCSVFDGDSCLSACQKEVRNLARKHSIPISQAEELRQKFEKYDEDNSGRDVRIVEEKLKGVILESAFWKQ